MLQTLPKVKQILKTTLQTLLCYSCYHIWNLITQAVFYLFKFNRNTKNIRVIREMCLKLTVRTPERRQRH